MVQAACLHVVQLGTDEVLYSAWAMLLNGTGEASSVLILQHQFGNILHKLLAVPMFMPGT